MPGHTGFGGWGYGTGAGTFKHHHGAKKSKPPPSGSPDSGVGKPAPVGHGHTKPPAGHEPAIFRSQATLQAFDGASYLATIALTRSPGTSIASVPVSRAIGAGLMVAGKVVAVIFFDHHNSADSMVVGVF